MGREIRYIKLLIFPATVCYVNGRGADYFKTLVFNNHAMTLVLARCGRRKSNL